MKHSAILEKLLEVLPTITDQHTPGTLHYSLLKQVAHQEVKHLFDSTRVKQVDVAPFGKIKFPYHSMGAVDSLNLFDLDELIIFSFYWKNRGRYHRVLDVGANLGLHSIILHKCGYSITCFEPDPLHFDILKNNLLLNNISDLDAHNVAMSNQEGEMEFIRVLGNTTGSHLAGAKANPYGELNKFPVRLVPFQPLLAKVDLVKMDIEGHEKEVLLSTSPDDWLKTDAFIEIENRENATAIYDHFQDSTIHLFSQKINWHRVCDVDDMPTSYREGSLFISSKTEMPWG